VVGVATCEAWICLPWGARGSGEWLAGRFSADSRPVPCLQGIRPFIVSPTHVNVSRRHSEDI
jgi:hypothetical protein